jgi:hypothetical protein
MENQKPKFDVRRSFNKLLEKLEERDTDNNFWWSKQDTQDIINAGLPKNPNHPLKNKKE